MKKYNVAQLMAQEQIILAFQRYGIEGTEQKIKQLYRETPKLKNNILKEYYNLLKGETK